MAQKQHIHTKAQEEAQRYIQVHSIDKLVTSMVNSLVQAKPQDPYVAMLRFLAKRCSPAQLQEAGIAPKSREIQRGEQHVALMQERERLLRLEQKIEASKPAKKPKIVPPKFDASGSWAEFCKGVEQRQETAAEQQRAYEAALESAEDPSSVAKPDTVNVVPEGCTLLSFTDTLCHGLREGEYEAGTVDPIEFQRLRSEEVRARVEWAATHVAGLVHEQTPLHTTFLMLVAFHLKNYEGEAWASYLTDRAICMDSARDSLGRSAADYATNVDSLDAPSAETWESHPAGDASDAIGRLRAGVPAPQVENIPRFFAALIAKEARHLWPTEENQDDSVRDLLTSLVEVFGREKLVHEPSGANILHALVAELNRESDTWIEKWTSEGLFEEVDADGRGLDEYVDGWPGEGEDEEEEKEEEDEDDEEDD